MTNSTLDTNKKKDKTSSDEDYSNSLDMPSIALLALAGAGLVAILFHGKLSSDTITAMMWAVASMTVGAVVGFLFGIPKTNKDLQSKGDTKSFLPNTNLEDVSDWLTKIIIGVGLIEMQKIGASLQNLAEIIAHPMNDSGINHTPFILACIVFYSMLGFLFGFLTTRLLLPGRFWRADKDTQQKLQEQGSQIINIKSSIQRHSALESVVAQGDYWLRQGDEMLKTDKEKGQNLLDKALNVYEIAISIDPNNIPARIGESKYYGACGKYKIARDKLDFLKADLDKEAKEVSDKTIVSDKTMARINYNIACYYFLDGISNRVDSDQRQKLVKEAFTFLKLATSEEPLFKKFAKLDGDWKSEKVSESEKTIFDAIVD